jgi:hypothetical protein
LAIPKYLPIRGLLLSVFGCNTPNAYSQGRGHASHR